MRTPAMILVLALWLVTAAASQNGADVVAAEALKEKAEECEDVATVTDCHSVYAAGCSLPKSGKYDENFHPRYDAYLAYFKNQIPTVLPESQGVLSLDDFVSLYQKEPDGITTNNHASYSEELLQMREGQYFTVVGYLYYMLINEGGEACNCVLKNDPPASDYHVGIGFDAALAKVAAESGVAAKGQLEKQSIIVEMTPHYRAKYHPLWTDTLLKSIYGRQVKVVGQLLLDNDHAKASDICSSPPVAADDKNCWRASPWELHPVTEFYVCPNASCEVDGADWVALDEAEAHGIGKSSAAARSNASSVKKPTHNKRTRGNN
jgi:hypothetical protein